MSAPKYFEFGPFRVDAGRRLLARESVPIPLAPKPFLLLLHLLRHAGQVLSKEQLIEHLWKDGAGSEANLSVNIAAVRRALGERPRDHRYVVTMPMRGYCFVADVHRVDAEGESTSGNGASAERPRRLAVLPFHVSHARPGDEHLGAGLADAVTGRIPPLRDWAVQSPQTVRRLAEPGADPLALARKLEVDAVVSGMIERGSERVVVSVRVNLVEDGSVHWGDSYIESPGGLARLPERIGGDLARAVENNHREAQALPGLRCSENFEAFQEYLKGRFLLERTDEESLQAGIAHFRKALELAPECAPAQAAIAGAYYQLWRLGQTDSFRVAREMETAARRALELDPGLPDPYFWLANLNVSHHWNWPAAQALFRLGLEFAPNSSLGHTLHSYYLALAGRREEAIAEARLGQELEPTNLFANATIANILRVTGRVDDAATQFETLLRMAPDFLWGQVLWGWTLASASRFEEARERFAHVRSMAGDIPWALAGLSFAHARLDDRETARGLLRELEAAASRGHVEPLIFAFAHFGSDDREQALHWFQKAYEERNPFLVFQRIEPIWGSFRQTPGLRSIFERIGAPSA